MAYFGKEFKFEKEENYEAFVKALAGSDEKAMSYLAFKPNITLLKNGDEYNLVLTVKENDFKKEIPFKAGVSFDEVLAGGAVTAKSVVNVDGDTFTQVQDFGKGTVTLKREFSADKLKVVLTSSLCEGTATRYYVPA